MFEENTGDDISQQELSDIEFGFPNLLPIGNAEHAPGQLKAWSAEDFSKAYVRFKPHLERHASRYLSSRQHQEEVVQDAFLYLLSALPEIDSEEGLLRFLKWKVKNLCLDIVRAPKNGPSASIDDYDYGQMDEGLEFIERAEDLAVIKLALSKLTPRHRQAIVANVYEELPASELSKRFGMTENATRQLLFRARRAFRHALVGELEVEGKSASEILAIASRRAYRAVEKNSLSVGIFALILFGGGALSLGLGGSAPDSEIFVASTESTESQNAGIEPPIEQSPSSSSISPSNDTGALEGETRQDDTISGMGPGQIEESSTSQPELDADFEDQQTQPGYGSREIEAPSSELPGQEYLNEFAMATILSTNAEDAGYYTGFAPGDLDGVFLNTPIEVFAGTGVSAFIDYDSSAREAVSVVLSMRIEDQIFYGKAKSISMQLDSTATKNRVGFVAESFLVFDSEKNQFETSPLVNASALIFLELDSQNLPSAASFELVQNTDS